MLALAGCVPIPVQPPYTPEMLASIRCWYAPAGSACPVYTFSCGYLWEVADAAKVCSERHGVCDEWFDLDGIYPACWEPPTYPTAKQTEG